MQNFKTKRRNIILAFAAAMVFFAAAFFIMRAPESKTVLANVEYTGSNIQITSADFGIEISKESEKYNQPWMTYSEKEDKVYVYYKYRLSDSLKSKIQNDIQNQLSTPFLDGSLRFAYDYMFRAVITYHPNEYANCQKDFNYVFDSSDNITCTNNSSNSEFMRSYKISKNYPYPAVIGETSVSTYKDLKVEVPGEKNDKLYMFGVLYRVNYNYGEDITKNYGEVCGITELTEFTFSDLFKDFASTAKDFSDVKDIAVKKGLCDSADEAASLKVNYYKMKNADEYETITDTYEIPAYAVWCENALKDYVLKKSKYGGDISYFDAEYETTVDAVLKGSGEAVEGVTDKRVMRRAKGFNYSLDGKIVTLDVDYTDFDYTGFCVHVNNNGSEFPNLKLDIYTTDHSFRNGVYTLEWDYGVISERLLTNLGWTSNFVRKNEGEEEVVVSVTNAKDTLTITQDVNRLTIKVKEENLNDLFGLSVVMVAQLVDDIKIPFTYTYMVLDDELNATWKTSPVTYEWYSDILRWKVAGNFERKFYGDDGVIYKGVHPETLGDIEYCTFNKVVIDVVFVGNDSASNRATARCYYRYNTLVQTINGMTGYEKHYVLAEMPQFSYKVGELDFGEIPKGYRINKVTLNGGGDIEEDKNNYRNSTITFYRDNEYAANVITVTATLTDEWVINIKYLAQHKDTPFAIMQTFEGKIKVLDFEDEALPGVLKKLTAEDLAKIIGIENMNVLKSTVDTIEQNYNDDVETYYVVPKYTFSSLKQIDYNGKTSEVKVPLTSYKAWASDYGKDWSILFLNSSEHQYFKYSNDVNIDDLYGYFATAVFKEQVSDFNRWFEGTTGDGCMVLTESMEVKGSTFYKISQKVQENSLFVAAAGAVVGGCIGGVKGAVIGGGVGLVLPSVVMSACELANDDNAMYYSYWFYLDCSSDLAFMSKNNAKNAEDTDGAAKNKFDDAMSNAGQWIKEKWTEFKASQTYDIVKWVLIVGACAVLVVLFVKLIVAIAKK